MTRDLIFADARSAEDLRTFVARARQVDDGGIRLAVTGAVVAATVCVLRPPGFGESGPTVLGLRTMALVDESADGLDVTVPLAAVADRLARTGEAGPDRVGGTQAGSFRTGATRDEATQAGDPASRRLPIPPTTLTEPWAGIAAPRRGWEPLGVAPADRLRDAARHGIELVRDALPKDAGSAVLHTVRRAVLAVPAEGLLDDELPNGSDACARDRIPLAAAYAAELLGFLGPSVAPGATSSPADDMAAFGVQRWVRLSNARGHVLVKV
ncbi:hypothetical protein V6N00_04980 [Tersicoccus sp. MR15.9]|uniref:hypothetical protein n=1 Tax=Tersicoccus mangrovi TaxID=3121635 RepID=UPI002FE5CB57